MNRKVAKKLQRKRLEHMKKLKKEMKKLDIIHDEAKAVGKVAEYKAKMQVCKVFICIL